MNTEGLPHMSLWDLPKFQNTLFCALKDTSLVLLHGCCLEFTSISNECKPAAPLGHVCVEQVSGQRNQKALPSRPLPLVEKGHMQVTRCRVSDGVNMQGRS